MLKYRNYRVYVPATCGERESNRVEFFPTKCRLPNTSDASRLAAALEDLRHELHPKLLTPPLASHGTPMNRAVHHLRKLLGAPITAATKSLTTIITPHRVPATVPRVPTSVSPSPSPRVPPKGIPVSVPRVLTTPPTLARTPLLHEARGRNSVGTEITKSWDGVPFHGTITEDNGRYYRVLYDDGDREQLTHREVTQHLRQDNTAGSAFSNGWHRACQALVAAEQSKSNGISALPGNN